MGSIYQLMPTKKKGDKKHTPMGIQCHIFHHNVLLETINNVAFMVGIIENI
jgi:hypothetical protein